MGAWGHGPFENDDAGDWIGELEDANDFWAFVRSTLDSIASAGDEYLEAPDCSMTVAAAEVVAASLGRPVDEEVQAWVSGQSAAPTEIVDLARRAVGAIKSKSELRELWEEGDGFEEWLASMKDLEARLASHQKILSCR